MRFNRRPTLTDIALRFAHEKEQEVIAEFRRNVLAIKPDLPEAEIGRMVEIALRETNN